MITHRPGVNRCPGDPGRRTQARPRGSRDEPTSASARRTRARRRRTGPASPPRRDRMVEENRDDPVNPLHSSRSRPVERPASRRTASRSDTSARGSDDPAAVPARRRRRAGTFSASSGRRKAIDAMPADGSRSTHSSAGSTDRGGREPRRSLRHLPRRGGAGAKSYARLGAFRARQI